MKPPRGCPHLEVRRDLKKLPPPSMPRAREVASKRAVCVREHNIHDFVVRIAVLEFKAIETLRKEATVY